MSHRQEVSPHRQEVSPTQTERRRERQTGSLTQTDRQAGRRRERQTGSVIHTDRKSHPPTQTDRQTHSPGQTDRQTHSPGQTDRLTDSFTRTERDRLLDSPDHPMTCCSSSIVVSETCLVITAHVALQLTVRHHNRHRSKESFTYKRHDFN